MLAGPSDITRELVIAQECIQDWNAVHARREGWILLATHWKRNVAPSMRGHPQEIINEDVLRNSDLLIGIFWNRLGTPTRNAESGTVEEVEELLRSKKDVMLYFSDVATRRSKVDREQESALERHKEAWSQRGVLSTFRTRPEFRQTFTRDLAHHMNRVISANSEPHGAPSAVLPAPVESRPPVPALSPEAHELLHQASQDYQGTIVVHRVFGGGHVQTNDKLYPGGDAPAKVFAAWTAGIRDLVRQGYIDQEEQNVWRLNREGHAAAEQLGPPPKR
jgi:hypothetical protein